MRLTPEEIHLIQFNLKKIDPDAEVFLYGSRVNEKLSGGDIDLLIVSEIMNFSDKVTLLTNLKMSLGDQKIDLSIKNKSQFASDPFFEELKRQGKISKIQS